MIIVKTIKEIREALSKVGSKKIAFVPTMGCLHQGHLHLVEEAKKHADIVVVSIFVNKAQFNDAGDYNNYPRDIDQDIKSLQQTGATHIFIPDSDEMLPEDLSYKIIPNTLNNCLCGSTRPGHFEGVSLILSKFFNIINPDFAIFGKKDFQQYLIVKKLIKDLSYDIEIMGIDPVREESGLVMSSRNARLSDSQKDLSSNIASILEDIKNASVKNPNNISQILETYKEKIMNMGFSKIDYLEIRKEEDLSLVQTLEPESSYRIFIAVYVGQIRLIDNLLI
ncbi:MAG: pantoate--beta-alanine ligase [Rickettsiales bacterium]|nr:pantoate--beta-alanine ligase [Rickettsiales bacterium]